ncbi:MAG TPA: hypothetical protein VIJ51_14665 [Solirubrobacteraceae bacterium]|jgi:hypothetical protein
MTETTDEDETCIFPGCDRPRVPRHELGGPRPHFCDLEEHNAASTHRARQATDVEEDAASTGSQAG